MKTVIRFVLLKTVQKCPFPVYGLDSHAYKRKMLDFFLLCCEDETKRKLNEKWLNTKQWGFLLTSKKKKSMVHKWRQICSFSSIIRDWNTVYIFIYSLHMKGTSYEHVYNCWCWPWLYGWSSVCRILALQIILVFPFSILYSLEGSCCTQPPFKWWGFMLPLFEGREIYFI